MSRHARPSVRPISRGRAARMLAALAACSCAAAPSALAQTETNASMHPSLLPDRLGASTALTLAFRFSGGAGGVPAPLRQMVMHLPAGLTVSLRGAPICAPSRLRSRGPHGCPSGSLVGRGHALMKVHAGSQAVPEEAAVSIYRGPDQGGRQTLEIFSQGETPLDQSTLSMGVLAPDGRPFGSKLTVSVPPIPTLMLEPDASFVSLSLTFGKVGHSPRAHTAAGSILVPHKCPAGGFPFATDFTFADGSTPSASGTVACP